METFILWMTVAVLVAVAAALIGFLLLSVRRERLVRNLWANFGLSLAFCGFFLLTWIAHGFAEWQAYAQEQRTHGESAAVSDFVVEFGQSTLENWQSEFLQLFSFVVFSAVLIHKGSAESKDGTEEIQAAVKRIEKRLDELAPARS